MRHTQGILGAGQRWPNREAWQDAGCVGGKSEKLATCAQISKRQTQLVFARCEYHARFTSTFAPPTPSPTAAELLPSELVTINGYPIAGALPGQRAEHARHFFHSSRIDVTCVACGMKHARTGTETCARIVADYSCEMCPFTPNPSGCIMMSVALALPVIGLIKDTSKGKNTETESGYQITECS